MVCFSPLHGFRSRLPTDSGKFKIVFNPKFGYRDLPMEVPCGQCRGCRLERSRQWAIRIMHETKLHKENTFLTLTYDDQHLPVDKSLDVTVFQKFMKRYRKKYGSGIRFYHCGEYGSQFGRPHYHAIIFGHDFADKRLWKVTNEQQLFVSEELSKLWPYGFTTIGSVTFESAAYVARYIMKKINGDQAADHYERYNPETGEIYWLKPEYTTMSRRPGIGKDWLSKYETDVFPNDYVVMRGKKMKPPKFYDRQYEIINPDQYKLIKSARKREAKKHLDNNTPERLAVREEVLESRFKRLPRTLD